VERRQTARRPPAGAHQRQADARDHSRGSPLRLYLDTSALLKLYLAETGSELVREHRGTASVAATSLVTLVEARAGLARRRRASEILPREYRHAVGELTEDWDRYVKIGISDGLVKHAAQLAERHRLRGYDAIHLASAMLLTDQTNGDVLFASWDDDLDAAAAREGFPLLRSRR
jgi:uncharacterized protein